MLERKINLILIENVRGKKKEREFNLDRKCLLAIELIGSEANARVFKFIHLSLVSAPSRRADIFSTQWSQARCSKFNLRCGAILARADTLMHALVTAARTPIVPRGLIRGCKSDVMQMMP